MKQLEYELAAWLAKLHSLIMRLNDPFEQQLSDRQLQILVVGILGMALFALVHPLIRWLARRGYEMAVSWLLTLILVVLLLFGVEIGQLTTATVIMDFSDLLLGVTGFLGLFFLYLLLHVLAGSIQKLKCRVRRRKK